MTGESMSNVGTNPEQGQEVSENGPPEYGFSDQDLELFRIMINQTNQELARSWVRNNILITINAGLLALFANSLDKISDEVVVLFCLLGMMISAIWFQVARMGKHYSERLRHDMVEFLKRRPDLSFIYPANTRRTPVRRPKGPNASKCMKALGVGVFAMWTLILLAIATDWNLRGDLHTASPVDVHEKTLDTNNSGGGTAIGIGTPITERPSHSTGHTDRVSGGSVVAFGYAGTRRLIKKNGVKSMFDP